MSNRTRMCVICKQLIDPERAADLPNTNLCTKHGEEIERFGGEFRIQSQGENLSKPGSLKRNPGGVKTRMVRNLRALEELRAEHDKQKTAN
jgi:hypothetical protein